jgi:RHS repeat-associated protein
MTLAKIKNRVRRHPVVLVAILVATFFPSGTGFGHDFGGNTGPGGPPPGDGCPGCCGGGGGGNPCNPGGPPCGSSGNPVNFWDGSERHTATDVRILGFTSIELTRTYDSRVDYDSPLGYGWAPAYDLRVIRYPDGSVMLRRTCGGRRLFVPSGGSYISPAGEFNNTLVDNGDGTLTLVEAAGTEYKFDLRGRLERVQDVNGNRLELEYDPAGRLPLVGTSRFSPNPGTPGVVALDYRITRIRERDALGTLTGRQITLAYDGATGRLQTVTDHTGRTWTYIHDAIGNLTSVTGPLGIVHTYVYADANDPHNLTSVNEGTTQFTLIYDAQDRVTRQTIGAGTVYDIVYTTPGVRTTVTKTVKDNLGAVLRTGVTVYDFNSYGNPTKITDALGNELTYVRDGEGNTTTREVRENRPVVGLVLIKTEAMTYDPNGNLTQETHTQASTGEVLIKTYTYDHNQIATLRVSSSLDPSYVTGYDRVWGHNARGYPTVMLQEKRIVSGGGTPTPTFYTLVYVYDGDGRLQTTTYPNSDQDTNTWVNGYQTGLNGETYTRDARGNPLTRTDRNGKIWTYVYDALDRVIDAQDPAGAHTLMTYTGLSLTRVEGGKVGAAAGTVTNITRDAYGRATRIDRETPSGTIVLRTTDYDSDGLTIRTLDSMNRQSRTTYDLLGRAATVVNNATGTTAYQYDALGNVTKVTDPAGRIVQYTNWLMRQPGKPLTVTNSLSKTYTAVLDAGGNLRTLTDPLSGVLNETHDALGRITSFGTAGTSTSFAYGPRGLLASRADAAGTTTYSYNSRGAITGIDYPGPDQVTLTLDAGDQVVRAVDADSDGSFTYDGLGHLTQEKDNLTLRSISYTYGPLGQRTSAATSDGVTILYEYDALGNLSGIRRNGTLEVSYVRDQTGLTISATSANGMVVVYTRDALGNLSAQESRDASNTLLSRVDYTRDASGIVTVKHEVIRRPDGTTSDLYSHYTFDPGLRMTREEIRASNDVTIVSARNFTYDDVGNRLTMTPDGGAATSYTYGVDYRLMSETTSGNAISYTYDTRGNLSTETAGASTVTYSYDTENRLIGLVSPGHTASYVLSYDGRRLAKVLDGVRTDYLNDGGNPIAEYPTGGPSVGYVAGLGLDEWLVRTEGGSKSYFTQLEDLRSVLQLTGPTGAVQNSYVYKAFGELIESVANTPNVRTFTGRTTDSETSHLYFRERLYSPRDGRFLSLDPYRPNASRSTRYGGSQRQALLSTGVQPSPLFDQRRDVLVTGMDVAGYLYVGNNPVNATDPTGEILIWNPASISITSACGGSGCVLSLCGASGCGISGCGGSGCAGSGCGVSGCVGSGCFGSGCGGSVCGTSVCVGSACLVSGCAGSGCAASACIGSACNVSLCGGSACAASFCAGSLCGGSACMISGCFGTACIGSGCGGSACAGSVCLNSTCGASICSGSTCGISVCTGSSCGASACTASGCGSSAGCSGSGCGGSICNAASGCNSPCCH